MVFIGSKSIGAMCLRSMIEKQSELDFKIVSALTNEKGTEISALCRQRAIPMLQNLEEYLELDDIDLLVSVQYHQILSATHLKKARDASVNLHMAPVPEYRGCNQFSFVILNQERSFGTTLHLMDTGVDSGDILCERRFEIPAEIWVEELLRLTERHSIEMFQEFLPALISGAYEPVAQADLLNERSAGFYKRDDISGFKELDFSWDPQKIARHIRALSMPGFSGPYFIIDGKRVFIEVDKGESL